MNRAKLFLENFFAYGLIKVLDKIIPLLLLPVITRLLTEPSDFGVYDMYTLIIGFGAPLAVLGMNDAMFREYFEKDDQQYRYNVTATANRIILVTSVFICVIFLLFNASFSKLFFGTSIYGGIIIFSAIGMIISANKTIIAAPTRIQNKRTVYVVSGLLSALSYYGLAILLIYWGYSYFGLIYANIISTVLLLIFFWLLNRRFFTLGKFDKHIAKELFIIGLPLVPVFLIYWVYHSMDRIMIANMLGTTEVGIYAIGAKVASISTFIYAAFAGGWQYFAFSTMRDDDYKQMIGKIWEVLFAISSCFYVGAFLFKDLIFSILFVGDYRQGVTVFPYLLFAPFLQMLYQILGTQFQVEKKTYFSPLIMSFGTLVNLGLNLYLIPKMGIEGAAIATTIGFAVTVVVCIITVVNIKKLVIFSKRNYLFLIIFIAIFIYFNVKGVRPITISIGVIYLMGCVVLYYKEAIKLIKKES